MSGLSYNSDLSDNFSEIIQGEINITTSAIEMKVGGSVLDRRRAIRIINDSNKSIYIGFDNTVTDSGSTRGEELGSGLVWFSTVTDSQALWAIGSTGTNVNVLVQEYA